MRWRSSWACQRSTSTACGSSADAVSAVQARSGSGSLGSKTVGRHASATLEGDEDARPSTRAGGLAVCTPDASQLWLERVSRLEHQSSFSVLGGVTQGNFVPNDLTKTAHLLPTTTSVVQPPAANARCGWRYAEGASSRLADAIDWYCGAWRACDRCFGTPTHT